MKKIKKLICFIVSAIMLFSITAYAETYPSYNYLANGEITSVPQPFAVDEILLQAQKIFSATRTAIYMLPTLKMTV